MIHGLKVSYTQATLFFRRADVLPGPETKTSCRIIFSDSYPPKGSKDSKKFGNKFLGEQNIRHIINRNGRKNRSNELQSSRMRKHISFIARKLSHKFIQNKIVSNSSILGRENQRVSQVGEVLIHGRNRKDAFNI